MNQSEVWVFPTLDDMIDARDDILKKWPNARVQETTTPDHKFAFEVDWRVPPEPTMLPKEAAARKAVPIASGALDFFPDAIAAVAEVSFVATQQHHPGQPMHWDRSKSTDEADALMRHFIERGTMDHDGLRHTAKVAWRALALLQKEIEAERRGQQG